MATHYEITYIIKPDIDDDAKAALIERFDKVLSDNGATVDDSKDWAKRRFAYESTTIAKVRTISSTSTRTTIRPSTNSIG